MNNDRQKILADYVSYLFTTRRTYDTIGKYIKYVTDFLESAEDINRRSYMAYKRENANIGARYPLMSEAICDLLHHLKIGYNRKDQKIKTLERLDAYYEIDDNGEVVPSLRQLDYNGGMSEMPLYVNFKKAIIELV